MTGRGARLGRAARAPVVALQRRLERMDWDEGTLLLLVGTLLGIASGLAVVVF